MFQRFCCAGSHPTSVRRLNEVRGWSGSEARDESDWRCCIASRPPHSLTVALSRRAVLLPCDSSRDCHCLAAPTGVCGCQLERCAIVLAPPPSLSAMTAPSPRSLLHRGVLLLALLLALACGLTDAADDSQAKPKAGQ